jgi:methylated-DNA-protein-cysteine methyltransferase related protein
MTQENTPSARRGGMPTFYDAVYAFVGKVPAGRVVTYGQVALELGAPAAARAVGYALHSLRGDRNVPWWRVINASGAISLKGRGTNADLQRELLEEEGVPFNIAGHTDLHAYRWWPGQDGES